MRYGLPGPEIVHEYIDGEAIVLNLKSGAYYSLPDTAAIVWELLILGRDDHEIAEALSSSKGKIDASLTRLFIRGLCEERLMASKDGSPADEAGFDALFGPLAAKVADGGWAEPVFEKFTDMQGFLLMDPIHDVGEQGWPSPKSDG